MRVYVFPNDVVARKRALEPQNCTAGPLSRDTKIDRFFFVFFVFSYSFSIFFFSAIPRAPIQKGKHAIRSRIATAEATATTTTTTIPQKLLNLYINSKCSPETCPFFPLPVFIFVFIFHRISSNNNKRKEKCGHFLRRRCASSVTGSFARPFRPLKIYFHVECQPRHIGTNSLSSSSSKSQYFSEY